MSETVAVRTSRWGSLQVWHNVDDQGQPTCRMRHRDLTFRTVDRAALGPDVEQCAHCAEETYAVGTHNGQGWAAKLRAAEDPEEVLAGND